MRPKRTRLPCGGNSHEFAREVLKMSKDRCVFALSGAEFQFLRDNGYGIRADAVFPRVDSRVVVSGFSGFSEPIPGAQIAVYF